MGLIYIYIYYIIIIYIYMELYGYFDIIAKTCVLMCIYIICVCVL
jgi:hypothetical protein